MQQKQEVIVMDALENLKDKAEEVAAELKESAEQVLEKAENTLEQVVDHLEENLEEAGHIAEAVGYRNLDRGNWGE